MPWLSSEDREYIRNWVKPMDHITARVIASGRGWKRLKVRVVAGPEDLAVSAPGQRGSFLRHVAAGATDEFVLTTLPNYLIEATARGTVVDRETDMRKTGL